MIKFITGLLGCSLRSAAYKAFAVAIAGGGLGYAAGGLPLLNEAKDNVIRFTESGWDNISDVSLNSMSQLEMPNMAKLKKEIGGIIDKGAPLPNGAAGNASPQVSSEGKGLHEAQDLTTRASEEGRALISKYMMAEDCDQVLDKGEYFICYNYKVKGARYVGYELDGSKVNAVNIKKRPEFYSDKDIPKRFRTYDYDYRGTGLDRGHVQNDANSDYSYRSLNAAYTMANIIPQYPKVNRKTWVKAEKYERLVATKLGKVTVINGIEYSGDIHYLGSSKIVIPSGFWKRIVSADLGFEKCFYYKNERLATSKGDKLRDHIVDCTPLR